MPSSTRNCLHIKVYVLFNAAWSSVISPDLSENPILRSTMAYFPQPPMPRRPDRARFADTIPAVLRFPDGQRTSGTLRVVSVTGGLLSLSRPIRQGSVAKLMFLTSAGSILGSAEMLSPVSWELQPFRFVGLPDTDYSRLRAAIRSCLEHDKQHRERVRRSCDRVENFRAW